LANKFLFISPLGLEVTIGLPMVRTLLEQGVLENWREDDGLSKVVFDAAATFPLPTGLQGLKASEFVAVLGGRT